jgi:phosphotransferase system HPr (HPr) family protein
MQMELTIMNGEKLEKEVTVANNHGRYVWPAASFVRLMNRFHCDVRVAHNGTEADGRNVLELMALAASHGCKVRIRVEGRDAAEAMLEIDRLIYSIQHL